MTLTIDYDYAALPAAFPPSSVSSQQRAQDGDVGFAGFALDDPAATIATVGHQYVTINESACSQPRLFSGWSTSRGTSRSVDRGMVAGPDPRVHDVTCVDLNACLTFRVLKDADAKRPAETMGARLAWLLAHWSLTPFVEDTGHVEYPTYAMEAADYTGGTAKSVLEDLVGRLANRRTYFCFWDPVANARGLYFGPEGTGIGESTLYISNDIDDVDGVTTFAPDAEAQLSRSPEEVYSEVVVEYARGTKRLFRKRQATEDAYVARGTTIQRPFTSLATTAQLDAEAFLIKHAVETDKISVAILVPPESAGLAVAGQRIDVKFTHLDGYADWTSMLIETSTIQPINDLADKYLVALVLGVPTQAAPEPEPVGFHQLILLNAHAGPPMTDPGGSATTVWGGSVGVGGISFQQVAVLQDTDGYTGTPGDLQDIEVTTWTIPEGLGGIYEVGWEQISLMTVPGDPWWLPVPPVGSPNPQPVPYTWSGLSSGNGNTLLTNEGISSITWKLVGTDLEVTASKRNGYWMPKGRLGPTEVYLAEGTELSLETTLAVYYAVIVPPDTVFPFKSYYGGAGLATQGAIFSMRLISQPPTEEVYEGSDLGPLPLSTTDHISDPTPTDDSDAGYIVGSLWVNTTTGQSFILVDATPDAAVWQIITTPDPITGIETTDPTVDDDAADGYTVGSLWVNTTTGETFILVDASLGVAVWVSLTNPVIVPSVAGIQFNIVAVFDAGTATITGNPEVDVIVPAAGTITGWTLLADGVGDAVIDIYSDTYGNYPPENADSITAAAPPTLASAVKATDSTLTGWDKTLTAGDILRFHLDSAVTVKRLVLTLSYTRS